MEIERAIEIITNAVQTGNYTAEQDKSLALVQKAVEKQVPKKIIVKEDDSSFVHFKCPHCKYTFMSIYRAYVGLLWKSSEQYPYCYHCGQALDWKREE